MIQWPHNHSGLTSAPVVVTCCVLIGLLASLAPDLTTSERLVAVLGAPAFVLSINWFLVTLLLRLFGRLRPASLARGLLLCVFYLGFASVIIGFALISGRYLGLGEASAEQSALDALQIGAALGVLVAARQALDRFALEAQKDGRG